MDTPWVEKYRPLHMEDVVGNAETVARLKIIAKEGNLPHLMLAGPPGTGKTTSVLCLARDLLGENYKEGVLELNASDDRGLDVVRNKIKTFATKKVTMHMNAKHKIVILDEADSMTPAAQQALRRTMELHAHTTRFAFACNNSSKIIEPIQSRCAVVRFSRLSKEDILSRVLVVIKAENLEYDESGLEALVYIAEGDLRNALNAMQAAHAGFGKVTAENVLKVSDTPNPIAIQTTLGLAIQKIDFDAAVKVLRQQILSKGHGASDIISTFFKVAQDVKLYKNEEMQLETLRCIGEATVRVAEGCGSALQLNAMLAKICMSAAKFGPPMIVAPPRQQ